MRVVLLGSEPDETVRSAINAAGISTDIEIVFDPLRETLNEDRFVERTDAIVFDAADEPERDGLQRRAGPELQARRNHRYRSLKTIIDEYPYVPIVVTNVPESERKN